ncbi:hypothetical protein J6590_012794 [Homalodisca vitripennis]|nr:hypothetical protein J6590_012794 [Homalodisca vitripennis]
MGKYFYVMTGRLTVETTPKEVFRQGRLFRTRRIWKADKAIEDIEKKCRRELTSAKRKLEDHYEQQEDPDNPAYGAGMH